MLEGSVDLEGQGQQNMIGPDLFGFYKCEVVDLLTQEESFPPFSFRTKEAVKVSPHVPENGKGADSFSHVSSLFRNSIENVIPDVKRELLKSSLRKSVSALTKEVDEVLDPVIRIRHVMSCLHSKTRESSGEKAPIAEDSSTLHCKKLKTSPSNSKGALSIDQSRDAEKETDVSVDLKLLLESEPILVEKAMIEQSDELFVMLNYMEKQLEGLLDVVVSKCRTRPKKNKMWKSGNIATQARSN
ncbi:uncharacterized protein LOC104893757 isoform X3 [Beta vulgaris subsp. vulgaris]|uniref:uncharacterized protein LOC104893757 isoform X3 n=1 Tax=Beta vulgaris subsp. vulgaris TaxID=3555 RepID=UPI0020368D81|nr:uncharacterized protein LOC104893757 isoform X3 [Beta vulgaris subsp. vulgaris]XP_057251084.1 uncharacterized protein LOC104893757 isoform X3 [Beta vulgaris subsp. vulgaris]